MVEFSFIGGAGKRAKGDRGTKSCLRSPSYLPLPPHRLQPAGHLLRNSVYKKTFLLVVLHQSMFLGLISGVLIDSLIVVFYGQELVL